MKKLQPVKSIMSTNLITVGPKDSLSTVKELFEGNNIHHIPVVKFNELLGIISENDLLFYSRGSSRKGDLYDSATERIRMERTTADEIMTKNLAKLEVNDQIRTAIAVFRKNKFHALPVLENDKLVGIVTTFDLIQLLDEEPISLDEYKS